MSWQNNILKNFLIAIWSGQVVWKKDTGEAGEREILTSFRLAGQIEFPFLEQVFKITRRSKQVKTGKLLEQTIYGSHRGEWRSFQPKNY